MKAIDRIRARLADEAMLRLQWASMLVYHGLRAVLHGAWAVVAVSEGAGWGAVRDCERAGRNLRVAGVALRGLCDPRPQSRPRRRDGAEPTITIHVNGGPAAWDAMMRDLSTPAVPLDGTAVLMREPDEEV